MTYGVVLVGRNDNYGKNLNERFSYCINSMTRSFDEIIYVDWNTEENKPPLIEEISNSILDKSKIKYIVVSNKETKEFTNNSLKAQIVVEVLGRNIGLRRLSTDFLVSSNIDIITPPQNKFNHIIDKENFYTVGLRTISLYKMRELGNFKNLDEYYPKLVELENSYGQLPPVKVCEGDNYSLISSPGDFQIAHKDVWYTIKGFEESLIGRKYADTNIQRKAFVYGFGIKVDKTIPVWHIGHEGGGGGIGEDNDMKKAVFMESTENLDTWGFSDYPFEIKTL